MDLDEIVRRFGELCALPADEAEKQRELCAAAMAQVEEERNGLPGGEVELERYAAAVACRRFVLRCLMSGGTIAIGEPRSGPAGAKEAACQLAAEYRRAAARGFAEVQARVPLQDPAQVPDARIQPLHGFRVRALLGAEDVGRAGGGRRKGPPCLWGVGGG